MRMTIANWKNLFFLMPGRGLQLWNSTTATIVVVLSQRSNVNEHTTPNYHYLQREYYLLSIYTTFEDICIWVPNRMKIFTDFHWANWLALVKFMELNVSEFWLLNFSFWKFSSSSVIKYRTHSHFSDIWRVQSGRADHHLQSLTVSCNLRYAAV